MKPPFEQRNPYKGKPERPWISVRLEAPGAPSTELDLLADTGNPCAIIISQEQMLRLKIADAPDVSTNFGLLQGASYSRCRASCPSCWLPNTPLFSFLTPLC